MTPTTSDSPGALLVRKRWDRPENVARRVERLARELEVVGPQLTAEQAKRLRALLPARKRSAS